MSVAISVKEAVMQNELGVPFTTQQFLSLGSRESVDKALSRLVNTEVIMRLARGVFARPRKSKYAGVILPTAHEVLELVAEKNLETIQIHGAEAVRLLGLSTQTPFQKMYYTSGSGRTIQIVGQPVTLIHTANKRLLQHAGTNVGLAISALLYMGKEEVTPNTVVEIKNKLSTAEFQTLTEASLPAWLQPLLNDAVEEE